MKNEQKRLLYKKQFYQILFLVVTPFLKYLFVALALCANFYLLLNSIAKLF